VIARILGVVISGIIIALAALALHKLDGK